MIKHFYFTLLISSFILLNACKEEPKPVLENLVLNTELLKVKKLSDKTYMHISYMELKNGDLFPCNGLIYLDAGDALIIDTPINDSLSQILINWIKSDLKVRPYNLIVTHFHVDRMGGINTFHKNQIQSFSSDKTIEIAKQKALTPPMFGFTENLSMRHGTAEIIGLLPGPGHTEDNIVIYLPDEKILFGGCLIKAVDASKGNLADANVNEWSSSVEKVKDQFFDLYMVVPGHGPEGGVELLDYTIELFK